MNRVHESAKYRENRRDSQPPVKWDQQRRADYGIDQMCKAEGPPVEGLALVGKCAIHKPGSGGDWMEVRKVRLAPNGAQSGERGAHTDKRTVHQIEGILVIDR